MARASPVVRAITLTTDIGAAYAAQMKAVLARLAPRARVVDLALDLAPHDIVEAGFLLEQMASGFPHGTVHVAVVDPGVGGRRPALAVRTLDGSYLVGPGNGLLDRLAARWGVDRAVRLAPRSTGGPGRIGATFDGRDLFAPAAAALARGTRLERLGPVFDYRPRPPRPPTRRPGGARGRVEHIDRFGNAITDLPSSWAPLGARTVRFRLGRGRWRSARRARVYEELPTGAVGLLPSSFGTLELARRERPFLSGATRRPGLAVELRWTG